MYIKESDRLISMALTLVYKCSEFVYISSYWHFYFSIFLNRLIISGTPGSGIIFLFNLLLFFLFIILFCFIILYYIKVRIL